MENFYYSVRNLENSKDYCFIMPTVAVGNVGQLSIDLLLSTLNVELIGRFHHSCILPIVGNNPYQRESRTLTTSCQIYACHDKKIVILQQRSPILPSSRKTFVSLLTNWVKTQGFKSTIVLSSCFNHFQTESDKINKIKFLVNEEREAGDAYLYDILQNWKKVDMVNDSSLVGLNEKLDIPGGGVTELLYQKFKEEGLAILILICYCSEGDNTPDALILAQHLNDIKPILKDDSKWKWPISWDCLFGNKAPDSIY